MIRRSRGGSLLLLSLTIALGLASRRYPEQLPPVLARYAGDVLWASMVFWWGALLFRRARISHIAAGALAVCVLVELSQLYRTPWLNALRDTTLGALVLGQGFLWSDLLCYGLGVLMAAVLDWILRRRVAPQIQRDPWAACE